MADESIEFGKHFLIGHQVNLGIQLSDNKFYEDCAVIGNIDGNRVQLEFYGDGLPSGISAKDGAKVGITSKEAWALCRCHAVLEKITDKDIYLKLVGQVDVQQRRQYFRLDVSIPVRYSIPQEQQLSAVEEEWKARKRMGGYSYPPVMVPFQEGFKVVGWENGDDIEPRNLNLSGGGLKFKAKDYLVTGTLVNLEIFLPLFPARVIYAVGSTVRCNALVLNLDRNARYSTSIEFKFIEERDRETIISYLFNVQRNVLRAKAEKRL